MMPVSPLNSISRAETAAYTAATTAYTQVDSVLQEK